MKMTVIAAGAAIWLTCAFKKPTINSGDSYQVLMSSSPLDETVKRGEYLVTIMGCADCHSPKKLGPQGPIPDFERYMSGHSSAQPLGNFDKAVTNSGQWVLSNGQNTAFVGPWGISFAANLTPDESGIGTWTFEQFDTAMRKGKYKGIENGRPLLPPMPWPNYTGVKDEDMRAIFAFLKSLKPVVNIVPSHVPADR